MEIYWLKFHSFLIENPQAMQVFTILLTWLVVKVVTHLFLRLAPTKYQVYSVMVSDKILEWVFNKLKIPNLVKKTDPETGKKEIVNVAPSKVEEKKVEAEKTA